MLRKTITFAIVSLFVIGGLVGLFLMVSEDVEGPGPTYVSGVIDTNTTWNSTGSPYIVTGDIVLFPDNTLTIESGTEVRFYNSTRLTIRGFINVIGTANDHVIFKAHSSQEKAAWVCIHIENEMGRGEFKYAEFYSGSSVIEVDSAGGPVNIFDSIFINNHGGISGSTSWGAMIIERCYFKNNTMAVKDSDKIISNSTFINNTYGLLEAEGVNVYDNTFKENYIALYRGGGELKRNIIYNNEIGVKFSGFSIINNTITKNNIGLLVSGNSVAEIKYNNLYNNSEFNIESQTDDDVDATYNWWGTTNTSLIDQKIYDVYDDVTLGEVIYEPFLTGPSPDAPTEPSGLQDSAPWPMFRRNVRHTGLSPYDTSGNTGELKWNFTTFNWIESSPAIGSDGTIYFGSTDGKLYALNPNGSEKWSFVTGDEIESSPAIGSDGTIYVGSEDKKLWAINPNGTEKWNFITGNPIDSSPAIGIDGTIYVGSFDKKLWAINPNGTEKWSFQTGWYVESSPAIGSDGTIYVGSGDGLLHAINPNGTEKWNFTIEDYIYQSPAIGFDGTIYMGSLNHKLYAINLDGTEKWNFTAGHQVRSSPAIDSDGTIFVGCNDGKLYAINPNGTEKWNFSTLSAVYSSPAIGSDGTIFVGSCDNNLYAINPDGSEKWSY